MSPPAARRSGGSTGAAANLLNLPQTTAQGNLRGTVVDLTGRPQGIGRVYLLAKSGLSSGAFADVDAAGTFDFGALPVGEYQVRFWGANLGSVPQQFPNPVRIDIKADVVTLVQFQIELGHDNGSYHDIFIGDYFFQDQPVGDPNGLVVAKLGTIVCWYNVGRVLHTVTGGPWGDSGPLGLGGNFNWTSDRVGTFPYRCSFHGTQMIATLQIIP